MGFKFGLYACASEYTCGSRAGSLYHERRDAATLASWGVDYLKFDDCGEMNLASFAKFGIMRDAIAEAGRPMVLSFEPYTGTPKTWVRTVGNSWRTGPDALPSYGSILGNAFVNNIYAHVAGPGHFNDADMMEIGNGQPGLSLGEARTQMTLWCLMKSPLLIGASLQRITKPYLDILLNRELISWNQDDAGVQGYLRASRAYDDGDVRGEPPAAEAAAALAAIAVATSRGVRASTRAAFRGVTYCAYGSDPDLIPKAQKFIFRPDTGPLSGGSVFGNGSTVRQGTSCLTAPPGTGAVTMAGCNGAAAQRWVTGAAAVTLAQIKSSAGLCLATDGAELVVESCVAKPANCSSLWNHNSSADGVDCTDDVRSHQLWYLNRQGQLVSSYIKGKGTEHHPDIVFYDPDDPYCLATAAAVKPAPPQTPPVVNYTLPLQVWAGELAGGTVAVALLNTGLQTANVSASWREIGLPPTAEARVRDLWTHRELGAASDSVTVEVPPHDVAALLFTPGSPPAREHG